MHAPSPPPTYSAQGRIVASYLASAWTALIGFALVPVYVHWLGIESYGLIGFFATLQMWLTILDLGLATTLNRESARFLAGAHTPQTIRNLLRSMELVYALMAAALALAVVAASGWIATSWLNAQSLDDTTVRRALMLMGTVIAIQWMGTLYRNGLIGLQRQVWLSGASALFATLKAAASVCVLVMVSPTITAFFLAQAAVGIAETFVLGQRVHRDMPAPPAAPRFSTASLRNVWRFAGAVTVIGILGTVLTQVDKVLLAKLLPLDRYGEFMIMAAVAGALSVLVLPIMNVAFPRFGELAHAPEGEEINHEYHRFAQLVSLGAIPASAVLMVFAGRVIELWTGDAALARAVEAPLRVWVLGTALNCLTHIPHLAQMAYGYTRLSIVVNSISVAVTVTLLLVLVPQFGVIAAAWIWVGVNLFYIGVAIPLMHRRILPGQFLPWLLRDVAAPAAAAIAVLLLAVTLAPQAPRTAPLWLLVAVSALTLLASAAATRTGRTVLTHAAARMAGARSGARA